MYPIRVLQMVGSISSGGMESLIMNYYRVIDKSKVQFDFLVREPLIRSNFYEKEILSLGGNIYRLSVDGIKNKILFPLRLYCFLRKHNYTIVHSHMDIMSCVYLFIAKIANVHCRIAHSHNTSYEPNKKAIAKFLLKPLINLFPTYRMACGEEAAIWLFGQKRLSKIKILPNAINIDNFKYNPTIGSLYREKFKINQSSLVIGHVGHFVYQKNHNFLLDIFNQIVSSNKDAILLLIGTGPLMNDVKNKVKSLELTSNVIFLGVRNDISSILQVIDIFVFPSNFEGLPVALIEAQASGVLSFVSTNIPKSSKITDTVHFISLEKDASYWASKILCTFNDFHRLDTSELMIHKGFSIKKTVTWLQNFYLSQSKS